MIKIIKLVTVSLLIIPTVIRSAKNNELLAKQANEIILDNKTSESVRINKLKELINPLYPYLDTDGIRLIHIAAILGLTNTIEQLIKKGCSIKDRNIHGCMAVHHAATIGQIETFKWLINNGASINDTDFDGESPIHYAAGNRQLEMVEWLLTHGATINDTGSYGGKPIHYAAQFGNVEMIKFLVKHGASINDPDADGEKPIHYATRRGQIEVADWLLKHGATINDTDFQAAKVIHYAAACGLIKMADWLIRHGAYINDIGPQNMKAIHLAIIAGQLEMTKFLIEQGSDIDEECMRCTQKTQDPIKQSAIKDYLTEMSKFFTENNDTFRKSIATTLETKQAPITLIQHASYRGHLFVDRLYNTICSMYDSNKREQLGFHHANSKELYLEATKLAPSSFKKSEWIRWCFTLCKRNIFESQPGSFEYEIKNILETKLETKDKASIKKYYAKNFSFGSNLYQLVIPNYIKTTKASANPNFVDININWKARTAQKKKARLYSEALANKKEKKTKFAKNR